MPTTTLHPTGTPGVPYAFSAKAGAPTPVSNSVAVTFEIAPQLDTNANTPGTMKTEYAENLTLDWLYTTGSATRPTTWFAVLLAEAEANKSIVELLMVPRESVSFDAASGGATQNAGTVTFTPTADGPDANYMAIGTAAQGGRILAIGPLDAPVTVSSGVDIVFGAGDIAIEES